MTSLWKLQLLSAFELHHDGEAVDFFGGRRDEQVLAYLAVEAPTSVPRENVAAALWPDVENATARKHLSFNLFFLKKRLAELGMAEPVEDRRKRLAINPSIAIDAVGFSQILAAAAATSSSAERVVYLQRAVGMYGAGLLPGLEFPWLTPHQDRFEKLFQETLSLLARTTQSDEAVRGLIQHIPPTAWQAAGRAAPSELPRPAAQGPAGAALRPLPTLDPVALAAFARQAEAGLRLPAERAEWERRVASREREIEAALQAALDAQAYDQALAIAVPLWRYWHLRGASRTGYGWLRAILHSPYSPPAGEHARALHAAGTLAFYAGRRHAALDTLTEAVGAWRALGDAPGLLRSLINLGNTLLGLDEIDAASEAFIEAIALAEALDDGLDLITVLFSAAACEIRRGNAAGARAHLSRRLALVDGLEGSNPRLRAQTLAHLGSAEILAGEPEPAEAHAREALGLYREAADLPGQSLAERILGHIAFSRDELALAEGHMQQSVAHARASGSLWELGSALGYLAFVQEAAGKEEATATMWHATVALQASGDATAAERIVGEVEAIRRARGA